jgi:hypothetical protein
MRRVRLVMGGSTVGHVEFYALRWSGPADRLCVPEGLLSEADAHAVAEALDRGEVVGRLGGYGWQASLETAAPVPSRQVRGSGGEPPCRRVGRPALPISLPRPGW